MLRKILNKLYLLCGYASAIFLALIAIVTFLQIVARQLGYAIETTEIAGFFLSASTFLGLSYTFINGEHVRVSLLSNALPKSTHKWIELWCCCIAISITSFAAWNMALFTNESYNFGDLSPGILAMPMWVPQLGATIGLFVMLLGISEQIVLILSNKKPDYDVIIDMNMGE